MKNTASLFKFVYLGTKVGFFIYFFRDILSVIS